MDGPQGREGMLLVTQSQQEVDVTSRKLDSGGTARYFSILLPPAPPLIPWSRMPKIHRPNLAYFLELHKLFGLT